MATAEMAGLILEPDERGSVRVIFPPAGIKLNESGADIANLLRHEGQAKIGTGSPVIVDSLESSEAIVFALVNGVKLRVIVDYDNYFL